MPFCNWCQLESETEDVCAWCRRPLSRNLFSTPTRDSVSLLREEGDSADRGTAIIGAIVAIGFIAILVYAGINYRGGKSKSETDPLSKVSESERVWSGNRVMFPVVPVQTPISSEIASPAPPAPPAAPPPRGAANQGNPAGGGAHSVATNAIRSSPMAAAVRDGEALPNGLYIDTIRLKAFRQRNGNFTVEGTVSIGNVSGFRAHSVQLFLVAGEAKAALTPLGKAIEVDFGGSTTVRVRAVDVDPAIADSKEVRVEVTATTAGGKLVDSLPLGG